MKNLHELDAYRITNPAILRYTNGWAGDETCGAFLVASPTDRRQLRIIASAGMGWDHVSVSREKRCPNWPEMAHVKSLFFEATESAMELHVPQSEHVNNHPFCLHLWRPHTGEIPMPPSILVGVASAGVLRDGEAGMKLRKSLGL